LETGWENDSFNPPKNMTGKKRVALSYTRMRKRFTSDAGEKTFSYLCRVYGKKTSSKQYFVRSYRRPRYYLPKSLFREIAEIELDGESFKIPKNYERYLKVFFGADLQHAVLPEKNEQNYLISASVPYKDYLQRLKEIGTPLDDILEAYLKSLLENRDSAQTLDSRNLVFSIARRSNDRRMLYEQLNPKMDMIRNLRSSKNYDELAVIFRDYTQLATEYLKEDLSLCPSGELLEIECEVLDYLGDAKNSEKLKQLAPPQHKEPLLKPSTKQ